MVSVVTTVGIVLISKSAFLDPIDAEICSCDKPSAKARLKIGNGIVETIRQQTRMILIEINEISEAKLLYRISLI
jgi:hypothetical protein